MRMIALVAIAPAGMSLTSTFADAGTGAEPIDGAVQIAAIPRQRNAWPRCAALGDFANRIHSPGWTLAGWLSIRAAASTCSRLGRETSRHTGVCQGGHAASPFRRPARHRPSNASWQDVRNDRGILMRAAAASRRESITLLGGAAAWPLAARAQQHGRVWRIGVLETTSMALNAANFEAFRQSLRDLGYIEEQNLIIEYRSAEGRGERFADLAADLLRLNIDVIVTRGTPAVLAAEKATTTTPIVMAAMGDPLMVVASLANPGGNITGLSGYTTGLEGKRAEVLKELVPGAVRIAGLYNMDNPVVPPLWNELQTAARKLGLTPQLLDIRKVEDIAPAFADATSQHADALIVSVDALTQKNRSFIAQLAAGHGLPAIYVSKEYIDAGGLIAYGPSYPDLYRRAAIYVDKILRGASPSGLPVEQPTKFELIINLKAARAIGLQVPMALMVRADEVIE